MNSIVSECSDIKHDYDKCFNEWFSSKFLKGDTKLPTECDQLFEKYQGCIRPRMVHEKLNIDDIISIRKG